VGALSNRFLTGTNKGSCGFLCMALQKKERSNIDKDEEIGLKKLASILLTTPMLALGKAPKADELIEMKCDA
jgi:hypothetical protein